MGATIHEIPLKRTIELGLYRDLDHLLPLLEELVAAGQSVARRLGTHRVWMLNSTAAGGGVAEMMPRVSSILNDLGVDTRWLVLDPGRPDFFPLTKRLHNLLHGESQDFDPVAARRIYEEVSEQGGRALHRVEPGDVLVVHDPQPAGVASYLRETVCTRTIWRCHIGVSERNESTRLAWDFLSPFLAPYQRLLFSAYAYIPEKWLEKSGELHPGIDPLAHKNRSLRPYKLVGILRSAGLVDGPEVAPWARFQAQAQRYEEGAWVTEPIPDLLHVPIILQVSRFDRLKGFQYLIPAFERLADVCRERSLHVRADVERVLDELSRACLILAGPDPAGVSDDPDASDMLEALCRQQEALPPDVRRRVHILRLPMADVKENALIVNCLQRIAAVVIQNSVKEGFGLTAAEALWKGTPVIASNVGGLAIQIRHGTDGLLVGDPTSPHQISDSILRMLTYPLEAESMGRSGRQRVREHFMVLIQVKRWLEELSALLDAQA